MAAEKGNRYSELRTPEEVKEAFERAYEAAKTDEDVLCLQDAIFKSGIPYSSYYDYAKNDKELEKLKKDTQTEVLRRVNRGALKGTFRETSSIFRMKQLGERDSHDVDVTSNGNQINIPPISWVSK